MLCRKCKKVIPDDAVFCAYCGVKQKKPARKPKSRGNGTGSVYQEANGMWTACVSKYVGDKRYRRVKKGFSKKKDALAALYSLSFDPDFGDVSKITFKELYDQWSREHYDRISDSKMTAYKIAYNRCESLYLRRWTDIRLSEFQAVVDARPSYYTARDVKQLCTQMGEFAIRHEYAEKNRATHVILPTLEKKEKAAFAEDEIKALWKDYEEGHSFTAYALVMIYTGMRYGEMSTIKKENVHLDEEKPYLTGGIKSEAGRNRVIPIAAKILPLVRDMYDRGDTKLCEMREDEFRKEFDAMTSRAKVRPLKPHACRHTFCTELARMNVAPAVIQALAGHAKYSTTLGYTHIQQLNDGMNAVNMLDRITDEQA